MENQDIHWKQRFPNYFKTFEDSITNYPNPSDIEKAGIIGEFRIDYEFALNTMKNFLSNKTSEQIICPRSVIKLALQNNLIEDENWLDMIESRSLVLEIYKQNILKAEYQKIKDSYYLLIEKFYIKTNSI